MHDYSQPIQFSFPTLIDFGVGVRHAIGGALRAEGCQRPLIVTDAGVAPLPMVGELRAELEEAGLESAVFADMAGNPLKSHVTGGVEAFHLHQADSVIALGGGAPLDVAKAVALMAHHPGDLFQYEDGLEDGLPVDQPIPYLIAIPTTAGTGSEVGRSAVVSEDDTKVKRIIFSPRLLPQRVFADPELTYGLPAGITAATGMDALTHLVEAFLAKGFHPMCDGIAMEGLRLVGQHLEQAVTCATNRDAPEAQLECRSGMLLAALMGAVAFQKGLGVTHSCAHALSTVCDLHHGLANGVMIGPCMAFNAEAEPERFKAMAEAVGAEDGDFVSWIAALQRKVGMPESLKEVGVTAEHLDALLDVAYADPCHGLNPRVVSRDDLRGMFEQVLG